MELLRWDDPKAYLERVQPWFEQHEESLSLAFGLALRAAQKQTVQAQFWAVLEKDEPLLVASFMRDYLSVSGLIVDHAAIRLVIQALQVEQIAPRSLNGAKQIMEVFVQQWNKLYPEHQFELSMPERMYVLHSVTLPEPRPAGVLRQVEPKDFDLVSVWVKDFYEDALNETVDQAQVFEEVMARALLGELWLWWVDDQPVSLVATSRPTRNGVAINSVYTPPELRGRGYASVAVAELSQRQLDQGRRFCVLFTDLLNPTSNKIYQAVGYRPLLDWSLYYLKK